MKAARFYGPGDMRVEDIDAPGAIASNEVRLKVLAAGICGSDIHNFKTGQWIAQLPVTPGHEFCGQIIEVGADVSQFQLGDLVVSDSKVYCGECEFCRTDRPNLCVKLGFVGEVNNGGFAEETVQPAAKLLRVPEGIEPDVAVLSEPLAVALRVVNRLALTAPTTVLVAGGGPIGGLVAVALSELGHTVLLAELNDARAQLLCSFENVKRVQLDESVLAELGPNASGVPYCVEATGVSVVLEKLVKLVSPGGRIATVGIFSKPATIDFNRIVEREIDIVGCSVFTTEQNDALAMLKRMAPKLKSLVSTPVALDAIPASYDTLASGKTPFIKTIVKPNASE